MRPSIETIEATFDYRDGGLYRKTNGRRGYLRPDGYVYVRLGGRSFGEHRLVHMMFSGDWPDQVDHVNGNRSDNRPENLRSATHAQNCMNRKPMSKAKGCYWMASRGKWMVQIGVGGSRRTIGYFDSIESARAAYRNAAEELHGDFARIN